METVIFPKTELEQMQRKNKTLISTYLYKRLLESKKNISAGKTFTRKELGI